MAFATSGPGRAAIGQFFLILPMLHATPSAAQAIASDLWRERPVYTIARIDQTLYIEGASTVGPNTGGGAGSTEDWRPRHRLRASPAA
jgi:hypothetical protein